ncbi:MAG: IS630 family transposase [Terrimicrobiaceae bacterium]
MARPIRILPASNEQKQELRGMINCPTTPQREARRARIVLHRITGLNQERTALAEGVNRPVVAQWEKRFREQGIEGLGEARRSGRKSSISDRIKEEIITEVTRPPQGFTQWSSRKMARAKGVSPNTVQRLWRANDLKPHLKRTFKVSNDPRFEEKFWDVIGLYLNPPERALVLCCDEKSPCQALERTQTALPLGPRKVRTGTQDYVRHGTIMLFAALSYLDGKIFRQTAPQHTHKEWLSFLKKLDRETPPELSLHLIIDNYATHKQPLVMEWITARNKRQERAHGTHRIHLHFTPTSSSWMNLVERFFRDLTVDCIRDGSLTSTKELIAAIEAYLQDRDLSPKRYVWKAEGQAILEKIQRARAAIENGE